MNKAQFITALAARLGNRQLAESALDAVLAEIQRAVSRGDRVTIEGFGVFERRTRAPRTARDPRTGKPVHVGERIVPAFRPGARFKAAVADAAQSATSTGRQTREPGRPAKKTPAKKAAAKKVGGKRPPQDGGSSQIVAGPPPGPAFPTDR